MRTLRVVLGAGVVWLSACGPNIPTEQRPEYTAVVYDPATSNLPTPNDLARVQGKVAITENPSLSPAENELKLGFNGLEGFSSASSARVQFTAPLSAASIGPTTAVALDLGLDAKGPVTAVELPRTYADCDRSLTFTAPSGFTPGHTYLFALKGGPDGLKDAAGGQIVESPAFHFLRAGKDLRQHPDAMPGATRAEKRATAERLESVRQQLEPHFLTLEAQGLPRRDVVGLWHFTVHREGEAVFDPGSKRIPFPNELLKDPATGLVSLPADPKDSKDQANLKAGFNTLDGFSLTADWSIESTTVIDRTTVTEATVRAFEAASGIEVKGIERRLSADGKKLVLRPTEPLLPKTAYVVVLQGVKDTRSQPLQAMPLPSVLKLSSPLTDAEGHSVVGSFCDDTAKRLETQRALVDSVVTKAGLERSKISATWTFTTQDVLARARALWEVPYLKKLPLTLANVKSENQPLSINISKKISGTLTTWDHLDRTTRAFKTGGGGEERQIEFLLWLPKNVPQGQKVPVVIVGHGVTADRTMAGPLAERLCGVGKAVLTIDFPLHGARTQCTKDSHCANGSTCAIDGLCRDAQGKEADFALFSQLALPGLPAARTASLDAWVDVANLFGTRDHFRQAIVDLSAEMRVAREADWRPHTGGVAFDPEHVDYVGLSLGAIIGGEVSGIDPYYRRMLLNVGGANLVDLIQDSETFGPTLRTGLEEHGIKEGTPAFEQFVNAARWALDEVDPLNLAPYAKRRPLVWKDPATGETRTAPAKKLRLHMANGDRVVPNSATEVLVKATGIDKATEFRAFTDVMNHILLLNPVGAAQGDMANFLENN